MIHLRSSVTGSRIGCIRSRHSFLALLLSLLISTIFSWSADTTPRLFTSRLGLKGGKVHIHRTARLVCLRRMVDLANGTCGRCCWLGGVTPLWASCTEVVLRLADAALENFSISAFRVQPSAKSLPAALASFSLPLVEGTLLQRLVDVDIGMSKASFTAFALAFATQHASKCSNRLASEPSPSLLGMLVPAKQVFIHLERGHSIEV